MQGRLCHTSGASLHDSGHNNCVPCSWSRGRFLQPTCPQQFPGCAFSALQSFRLHSLVPFRAKMLQNSKWCCGPTTRRPGIFKKGLKQQSCSATEAPCPIVQRRMLACLHCHYDASNHTMIAAAIAYYSSSHVHAGRHGSPRDQLCSLCLGIRQTCCQQCLQRYHMSLCRFLLSAQ